MFRRIQIKRKWIFTLGYVNDEGIKINSDYNRLNASFKIRQKLAKTLDLDVGFPLYGVKSEWT